MDNLDVLLAGLGEGVKQVLPDHVTFYGMREVWFCDNPLLFAEILNNKGGLYPPLLLSDITNLFGIEHSIHEFATTNGNHTKHG